jgi:hypothetical protein
MEKVNKDAAGSLLQITITEASNAIIIAAKRNSSVSFNFKHIKYEIFLKYDYFLLFGLKATY